MTAPDRTAAPGESEPGISERGIVTAPRSRLRIGLGAAVVLLVVGVGIAVLASALAPHGASAELSAPLPTGTMSSTAGITTIVPGSSTLYVHILGDVVRPGLYLLQDGDRAVDAVAAAGGFAPTADQSQLNLARLLVDGEQIFVPAVGQSPAAGLSGSGSTGGNSAGASVAGKVNVNTADATTLETLPRVGPAMAKRILDWRTANGRFSAIEDLMSVTGIGEKTFDGLKELVTV
ncbi:MAG: competence protein ComEA [Microbacteriaceae bacterium]|nr:competence protein ComEA [Microbacteriaceae bacterium]